MPKNHPRRSPRMRSVALATGMLVLGIAPFGIAATGDALREGQRNGTATRETQIVSRAAETGAAKGGYATRQSNVSNSGGGAIYGCRAGTGDNMNPCMRSNNLEGGLAFEFNATKGDTIGTFTAGAGGDTKKPFTTNATGVATGLNADRVDGQDAPALIGAARAKDGLDADTVDGASAAGLRTRWLLVNEQGEIEAQSGGFAVLDGYVANQNIYIDAGEDLVDNGLSASLAIRNQGGTQFGGEISVSRCQIPGVVECAPSQLQEYAGVRRQPAQQRRDRDRRGHPQAVLRDDHGVARVAGCGSPTAAPSRSNSRTPSGTSPKRIRSPGCSPAPPSTHTTKRGPPSASTPRKVSRPSAST